MSLMFSVKKKSKHNSVTRKINHRCSYSARSYSSKFLRMFLLRPLTLFLGLLMVASIVQSESSSDSVLNKVSVSVEENNQQIIKSEGSSITTHLRLQSGSAGPTISPHAVVSKGPTSFPVIVTTAPTIFSTNSTSSPASSPLLSTRAVIVIIIGGFLFFTLILGVFIIYNRDMWSTTVKRGMQGMRRLSQKLVRTRKSLKGFFSGFYTGATPMEKKTSNLKVDVPANNVVQAEIPDIYKKPAASRSSQHTTTLMNHFAPAVIENSTQIKVARRSSVRNSSQTSPQNLSLASHPSIERTSQAPRPSPERFSNPLQQQAERTSNARQPTPERTSQPPQPSPLRTSQASQHSQPRTSQVQPRTSQASQPPAQQQRTSNVISMDLPQKVEIDEDLL